jgi:hypothetical protein
MSYTSLDGGYLTPLYLARRSEGWTGESDPVGGSVQLATYPKLQGDYSLQLTTLGTEVLTATSRYPTDFADFHGVGIVTYTPDATPLAQATLRLYTSYVPMVPMPPPMPYMPGAAASYFEFSWSPSAAGSGGTSIYGTATYYDEADPSMGAASYGYAQSITFGDWVTTLVAKTSFRAVGTPSWGRIEAVEITLESTAGGTIFFDVLSGWTQLPREEARANAFIERLPEYHWDQSVNDAIAQGAGYELDALWAAINESLPQGIPGLAGRMLLRHEDALGLPAEPYLYSDVRRRNLIKGLLSMPVTTAELQQALSLAAGQQVRLHEDFANYSLDVSVPLDGARFDFYSCCHRLVPAHLGVTIYYDVFYAGDLAGSTLATHFVDTHGDVLESTTNRQGEQATATDSSATRT